MKRSAPPWPACSENPESLREDRQKFNRASPLTKRLMICTATLHRQTKLEHRRNKHTLEGTVFGDPSTTNAQYGREWSQFPAGR